MAFHTKYTEHCGECDGTGRIDTTTNNIIHVGDSLEKEEEKWKELGMGEDVIKCFECRGTGKVALNSGKEKDNSLPGPTRRKTKITEDYGNNY